MVGSELVRTQTQFSIYFYDNYINSILNLVNQTNPREVILFSPVIIGERYDGKNPYDEVLEEMSGICATQAKQYNFKFYDLYSNFLKYLEKHNLENLDHSILTYDGIHLNPLGHRFLATEILISLGIKNITTFMPAMVDYTTSASQKQSYRRFYHRTLNMSDVELNAWNVREWLDSLNDAPAPDL